MSRRHVEFSRHKAHVLFWFLICFACGLTWAVYREMRGWVSWKRKCESWLGSGLFGLSFLLYGSIASIKCKYLSVPVTFFLFLLPRKRIQTQTLDVSALTWSSYSWNFSFYLILHLYRIQFLSLQKKMSRAHELHRVRNKDTTQLKFHVCTCCRQAN